jgi:hypothetical protein
MTLQLNTDQAYVLLAAPLLPGKAEAWRRLAQEIAGWQGCAFLLSRRALGITAEGLWLATMGRDIAVITVMAERPERIWPEMVGSERPFDRWFCQQLEMLLGIEMKRLCTATPERVLTWKERAMA